MLCANCGHLNLARFDTCPCYWDDDAERDMRDTEPMIDPISQPERISTRIWDYSPRGYYSMRGRDEGKLVEAEMFWTSFDDVVWC